MNTCIECLPCLGRIAVETATRSTGDPELREKIVTSAFQLLSQDVFHKSPPYYAKEILKVRDQVIAGNDIYIEEKKRSNQLAKELLKELSKIPQYDPENFESRLRLAIAGNILDFGVYSSLDMDKALEVVRLAFTKPIDEDAVKRVRNRMDSAEKILYLLDNCGEAVFDRVFIKPYRKKTVLGVRGCCVFNDVTEDDLEDCGLSCFARGVISNGPAGIPGTILEHTSEEFKKEFFSADLIISKGQGNFETLNESSVPIAFLFLAKCPVVIREIGAELHSLQVRTLNF